MSLLNKIAGFLCSFEPIHIHTESYKRLTEWEFENGDKSTFNVEHTFILQRAAYSGRKFKYYSTFDSDSGYKTQPFYTRVVFPWLNGNKKVLLKYITEKYGAEAVTDEIRRDAEDE